MGKGERMSVLEQNQNAYDAYTVREAVICGHKELEEIRCKRDALYAKSDFTEEDGNIAADLETKYGELGGYECEIDAETLFKQHRHRPSVVRYAHARNRAQSQSQSANRAVSFRQARYSAFGRAYKQPRY